MHNFLILNASPQTTWSYSARSKLTNRQTIQKEKKKEGYYDKYHHANFRDKPPFQDTKQILEQQLTPSHSARHMPRLLVEVVEVLLYFHRNRRFIRDGSPGRPPRPSHSSERCW